MRSLFSGVSGLKAHQTGMDVIGNNIANVNTTGFKSSRTTFADTLSQTLTGASAPGDTVGGTNPKQIGLGTGVASIDMLFTDGSVQSTGKNTDLCLSGNGLFVVKNGNQTYYTRDGAFEFDSAGNYVLPSSGLYVQGWMATDGVLSTNGSASNITIPAGKSMVSKSSSVATYANNLNAAALTIKSITGGENAVGATKTYTTAADGVATANKTYPLTITLADGTVLKVEQGSFTVGNDYTNKLTTNGNSIKSSTDNELTLTLADGTILDDTDLTDGKTYTVGNTYIRTLTQQGEGVKKVNANTLKLTLLNGTTIPDNELTNGDTYKVGDTYTKTHTSGSVTKSASNTLKLKLSDGTIVDSGLTDGTAYNIGAKYPTTANTTITSIELSSDIKQVEHSSNIKELDEVSAIKQVEHSSNIKELDEVSAIKQIDQPYTKSAKASKAKPITLTMSDGTTITQTSGSYTVDNSLPVTTTLTVYDSLGNAHNVPVYFTKTKTDNTGMVGNQWTVSLDTDVEANSATIKEDDGSVTTLTMEPITLQFDTNGKFVSGNGTSTLTLTNGSGTNQQVTLDLTSLTQYAGKSTVNGSADGNAAGTLSSVSVDSSGIITGTYTNGVKQAEAQVAIAQFTNASGLEKNGNSLYQESNNSGTANVKTASDLGVTITPSALEMSNVDIANEFSNMIVTQRGFQSNSKIITVGDEMLETLINMKR